MSNELQDKNEIFYERTDINEFLREHPMVSDLYDATLQVLYAQGQPQSEALRVFNQAYYLCLLITAYRGDKQTILRLINDPDFEKDYYQYPLIGLNLMVVKCLLRVHQELLSFDSHVIEWLGEVISEHVDQKPFNEIVKNYVGEFTTPLNFSGKYVEVPVEEKQTAEDPYCMLVSAQNLIKTATEKLTCIDDTKDKRIAELEELLRLEKEKNSSLTIQIKEFEGAAPDMLSAVTVKTVDELYSAINYLTIKNYAMGRNEAEASVISNMLGKLAIRGNLGHESLGYVNAAIEEIDNLYKPQPSKPNKTIHCEKYVESEVHNDNKDSQVFNGKIDNSKFGK